MRSLKHAVAAIMLALSLASQGAAGPFEDARDAYQRRDYATFLQLIRPLADQGDAKAQCALGSIYVLGRGVPEDYAEALKWLRLAANHGNADAQNSLGGMYREGQGVPQDDAEA